MNDPQPQENQPEAGKPRVPHGDPDKIEKRVREQQDDSKSERKPETEPGANRPSP
jgi:hypothetical protein